MAYTEINGFLIIGAFHELLVSGVSACRLLLNDVRGHFITSPCGLNQKAFRDMNISGGVIKIGPRYRAAVIGKRNYSDEKSGNVQITDEQYFGNVPFKAWELTIGGYQPAQKWLKDRRGSTLNMEEIQHYQKITVAMKETGRVVGG